MTEQVRQNDQMTQLSGEQVGRIRVGRPLMVEVLGDAGQVLEGVVPFGEERELAELGVKPEVMRVGEKTYVMMEELADQLGKNNVPSVRLMLAKGVDKAGKTLHYQVRVPDGANCNEAGGGCGATIEDVVGYGLGQETLECSSCHSNLKSKVETREVTQPQVKTNGLEEMEPTLVGDGKEFVAQAVKKMVGAEGQGKLRDGLGALEAFLGLTNHSLADFLLDVGAEKAIGFFPSDMQPQLKTALEAVTKYAPETRLAMYEVSQEDIDVGKLFVRVGEVRHVESSVVRVEEKAWKPKFMFVSAGEHETKLEHNVPSTGGAQVLVSYFSSPDNWGIGESSEKPKLYKGKWSDGRVIEAYARGSGIPETESFNYYPTWLLSGELIDKMGIEGVASELQRQGIEVMRDAITETHIQYRMGEPDESKGVNVWWYLRVNKDKKGVFVEGYPNKGKMTDWDAINYLKFGEALANVKLLRGIGKKENIDTTLEKVALRDIVKHLEKIGWGDEAKELARREKECREYDETRWKGIVVSITDSRSMRRWDSLARAADFMHGWFGEIESETQAWTLLRMMAKEVQAYMYGNLGSSVRQPGYEYAWARTAQRLRAFAEGQYVDFPFTTVVEMVYKLNDPDLGWPGKRVLNHIKDHQKAMVQRVKARG